MAPPVYAPGQRGPSSPQWGASPAPSNTGAAHPTGRGRTGLLVVGAVLVGAAIGAGVTAVALRQTGPKNLDQASVTAGVQSVLTGSYGLSTASAVACPRGMTTKPGNVYTCTFTVGSTPHTVKITIQNDAGQYQVGSPA